MRHITRICAYRFSWKTVNNVFHLGVCVGLVLSMLGFYAGWQLGGDHTLVGHSVPYIPPHLKLVNGVLMQDL